LERRALLGLIKPNRAEQCSAFRLRDKLYYYREIEKVDFRKIKFHHAGNFHIAMNLRAPAFFPFAARRLPFESAACRTNTF
jgi:hypothetical protein